MDKYIGPERRKFARLSANFVISYRVAKNRGDFDLSLTKNISQGGILLTTNRVFDIGTTLAMTIRLPFIKQKIEVLGVVVDSKVVVRDLIYETRVKFVDFDHTEFFKALGDFIKEHITHK